MKHTHNFFKWVLIISLIFSLSESFARNQVTGKVVYTNEAQTPISGVEVHLIDLNDILLQTTLTNDSGYFFFYDMPIGTYTVTASSDQTPPAVVDLLDVSLLIDYLNGEITFEPLKEKAADVNGVDGVDTTDLNFVMENWYLNGEPFPVGDWIFEEKTVQVGGKEGEIVINTEITANIQLDYDPLKNSHPPIAQLNPVEVDANSLIEFPVESNSTTAIKNFYLEMAYDPTVIQNVEVEAQLPGMKSTIDNNRIKIIWADLSGKGIALSSFDQIFSLRIQTGNTRIINSDILWITKNSSFVNSDSEFTSDASLYIPQEHEPSESNTNFVNVPNPVSSPTTFQYILKNDGLVQIDILNLNGLLVERMNPGVQSKGPNSWHVSSIHLSPGMYIARLKVNHSIMGERKLIVK